MMAALAVQPILPPGQLQLNRAAHDLVGSSYVAFRICATLLVTALVAELKGRDVPEAVRVQARRPRGLLDQ